MTEYISGINSIDFGGSHIDGQWVFFDSVVTLSSSLSIDTYSVDISSYLPNDDNVYEVMVSAYMNNSGSTCSRIYYGTDMLPLVTEEGRSPMCRSYSYDRYAQNLFIFPTKTRTFNYSITGSSVSSMHVNLIGYRRLGKSAGSSSNYVEKIKTKEKELVVGGDQFCGQWHLIDYATVFNIKTAGTHTADISQYLPEDGYNYEVILGVKSYNSTSATGFDTYLYTDISPTYEHGLFWYNRNYGRRTWGAVKMPTKDRKVFLKIGKAPSEAIHITLIGYRRLGSNV